MEAGGAKADISNETAALTPRNLKKKAHASHEIETQSKDLKKNRESKYSQRSILGVDWEYLFIYICKLSQKLTYFACAL